MTRTETWYRCHEVDGVHRVGTTVFKITPKRWRRIGGSSWRLTNYNTDYKKTPASHCATPEEAVSQYLSNLAEQATFWEKEATEMRTSTIPKAEADLRQVAIVAAQRIGRRS